MKKRDRFQKKTKRTGKAKHISAYRQLRNRTTKIIRESHAKYVEEVMGDIAPSSDGSTSTGIKWAWSYIKLLRSEFMGIPALFCNNRAWANDVSKAEALRQQYESVLIREDLNNIPILAESPYQDIPDIKFLAHGFQKLLEFIRPDKACGPDQIPARVLKESASHSAPILASLFQQNLMRALYSLPGKIQISLQSLKRGILLTVRIIDLCH